MKYVATINGKKYEVEVEKEAIVPPRNNLDSKILDAWKQVLNLKEISII